VISTSKAEWWTASRK